MTDGQVTHLVIALGSNYQADTAFACAVSKLQKFGEMRLSLLVTGSDFTGRSQRVYHNAVAHIALTKSMQYTDIETTLKQIEQACGRDPAKKCAEYDYEVAMDLDILAASIDGQWQMNPARLPLKGHDMQGVRQVADFLLDLSD